MNHAQLIRDLKAAGGPVRFYRNKLIDAMGKTGGGTADVIDTLDRVLAPYVQAAEALALSNDGNERHSTQETVSKAQELMRRTENTWRPEDILDNFDWLRDTARSLAGSVISQADPSD